MDTQTRSCAPFSAVEAPGPFPKSIHIKVDHLDEVCLIRFQGHFRTGDNPEYLSLKMNEVRRLNRPRVLADFWDVPSLGSAGINFIVGLYWTSGGRLVLVGIQPRVREVLDMTRLSNVMLLADDIESGLAVLRDGFFRRWPHAPID
jgi:anti-anti-sigma factor